MSEFGGILVSSLNSKTVSNPRLQRITCTGTHMHGLAVYVKEGLPFARDLSLENSADSYLCFRLALLHCVLNFSLRGNFAEIHVFQELSHPTIYRNHYHLNLLKLNTK